MTSAGCKRRAKAYRRTAKRIAIYLKHFPTAKEFVGNLERWAEQEEHRYKVLAKEGR